MDNGVDVGARLRAIFALDSQAPAIEFQDRWYSFGELEGLMHKFSALAELDHGQNGIPVAVLLRNRPAQLAVVLDLLMQGHCVVTVNPMQPMQPLCEDVQQLRAPWVVADSEDWRSDTLVAAARAAGSRGIWVSTSNGELKAGLVEQLSESQNLENCNMRPPMSGVAIEMLSSGTTGKPKRISLSYEGFSRGLEAGARYESGATTEPRLRSGVQLQWTPLVHIAGLWNTVYGLYNGRRLALMERFDVDLWHQSVLRHRPRFANFPPTALRMVLERDFPKEDFSSLLAVRSGAAPLDPALALRFEEKYGVPVLQAYGATEFAGGVAGWTLDDHRKFAATKRSSVGRPNAGVSLRVVDPKTFEILNANQEGLLEVRTSQVDGGRSWIRTTDLARLDEDGFLYIVGRADGAIVRGGFKVLPEHVESVLRTHPAIQDACVVGLADERLGQVPVAAYELRAGAVPPEKDELHAYLRERVKPYEIPVRYKYVAQLPRTPSMKVSQPAVRQLFELEEGDQSA
jgi:long-chain acyl-CoA synthetase